MDANDPEQNHWRSDRSTSSPRPPVMAESPSPNPHKMNPEKTVGEEEHETLLSTSGDQRIYNPSLQSTDDEMELDKLASDFELTDDEESGLTNQHRTRRKRRKGKITTLDDRVAEGGQDDKTSKHDRKLADMSVLKSSAINALLIGLWLVFWATSLCMYLMVSHRYLFSLSISIVSSSKVSSLQATKLNSSTTSGCFRRITSISISPFSRLVCICLCSSRWLVPFFL